MSKINTTDLSNVKPLKTRLLSTMRTLGDVYNIQIQCNRLSRLNLVFYHKTTSKVHPSQLMYAYLQQIMHFGTQRTLI